MDVGQIGGSLRRLCRSIGDEGLVVAISVSGLPLLSSGTFKRWIPDLSRVSSQKRCPTKRN